MLSAVPALIRSRGGPTPFAHLTCAAGASYWKKPLRQFILPIAVTSRREPPVNLIHPIAAPHSESKGYSCRAPPTHLAGPRAPRPSPDLDHTSLRQATWLVSPPSTARRSCAASCSELARCLVLSAAPPQPGSPASPSRPAIANSSHTSSPSLFRPSLLSEAKLCALAPHHTTPVHAQARRCASVPRPDKSVPRTALVHREEEFFRAAAIPPPVRRHLDRSVRVELSSWVSPSFAFGLEPYDSPSHRSPSCQPCRKSPQLPFIQSPHSAPDPIAVILLALSQSAAPFGASCKVTRPDDVLPGTVYHRPCNKVSLTVASAGGSLGPFGHSPLHSPFARSSPPPLQ